ncbi:MAG: bifunctional 23S rRNA (guanine(2069)-N(7))-methyltransferase RlmK/23S rRNA (guanine(2445)-N(2))-methyltransferase RlmL [Ectothiorhodospiraceae bacterium]|nr:bifunctional 23S rRNA (guanine(2069)-N(7))-methyltransferase RlmK/23S rRNA (guanine(2445)-N(2))-methyltransferase RlmL [Chromatiales bacterium]MCP5155041.1 bifunctional 23S rRNA (guanine(2069)-N(7))-methyltransferase RlmK/23S rRNA (guanine(2445)-N(2))-methyltransferase RlmL [Ectothiorhodospiraceae bacterium]
MNVSHHVFAPCARGLGALLADEARAAGAEDVHERPGGVEMQASLATAYRLCLWSRVASRVLLRIATVPAESWDALYAGVLAVPWREHLRDGGTIAVVYTARRSPLDHTLHGARRVKDAVVDQLRAATGTRPSVSLADPDVRIAVHVEGHEATVSIDLAGEPLHRRGYRDGAHPAPLRETLAAGIVLRAGWPALAAEGADLVDPMCGTGTLAVEAALIAGDVAPGLLRADAPGGGFGLVRWAGHDAAAWQALCEEARARRDAAHSTSTVHASDVDARAVEATRRAATAAGVAARMRVTRTDVADLRAPSPRGLVVANPPYGERLGSRAAAEAVCERLGATLRNHFAGWQAAILLGDEGLAGALRLRASRTHRLWNGPIECRLVRCALTAPRETADGEPAGRLGPGAEMLANRLRKNQRALARWRRREDVACYRLYDADLPEYAVAVDVYESATTFAHLQEYAPPPSVDPATATRRLREAVAAVRAVLGLAEEQVVVKRRERQRGTAQYTRQALTGRTVEVREGACRLLVNLWDYLDTGLFLDHRPLRQWIGEQAAGRRFLNLFAYTGAASVHAARGGAVETLSVDLSPTYVEWGERNLALNGLDRRRHRYQRADCLRWLEDEAGRAGPRYDLILLDPPTFSNSKRMASTLDVQRDHVTLIRAACRLLAPGGTLVFSTNRRRFRLDREQLEALDVRDIGARTVPPDFARRPDVHRCFEIRPATDETYNPTP